MVMLPSSMNGSVSATLPLLQQSADTFNPSLINGDIGGRLATPDGPTVRQHLQQQQAAQRQRQQQEAMVRRLCQQQREESAGGWTGGGGLMTVEKLQQNQQQMNTQRRRPQIESAPPSVTANFGVHGGPSPCSFPPSVPSSSAAAVCAGAELQPHIKMVSAAPPLPPSASKTLSADSLSSPSKRGGRSRAVGRIKAATAGAVATNLAMAQALGVSPSVPGVSSADTLASTIASVASGGGSFEFEKAIGTSPLPSSLPMSTSGALAPPGGDASTALLTAAGGVGAVPSTSAQPQQLIASPGVKRRRTQPITQAAVAAIVNALEQPPMVMEQQMAVPSQPVHAPVAGTFMSDSLSHPLQQQQPSLGMGGPPAQHEQITVQSQCRIHVQNPPQTHGDFPPTGTKIQVVHMQPPAAAVSHHQHLQQPITPMLSDSVSPQLQHPSQHSHGHFSPSSNLVANQTNGRPYLAFPQHYMVMDGCSPIPQPSPSMPGDHFPAQSPAQHPSTLSTAAILTSQGHHHHQVPLQHQDVVTSPPVVALQCTTSNSVGAFPQQHQHHQHQFTLPTPPAAHHHLQQFQAYQHHHQQQQQQQQLQRYQLQQQPHSLGGCPTTSAANFHLEPQSIMVPQQQQTLQTQSQPSSSSSHHAQPSSHQRFGALLSPTPPPPSYPSSGAIVASKLPPFFRSVPPPSPFVCPAPPAPAVVLSQPPPMGSPLPQRAQLSRAQLLSRHSQDVEARKFAVKLYHLQRTVKALVYKNGALADELARLNQRICTVTAERKMLAKRLQHHERNRIRRIQSQYRKAIAAAAASSKQATNSAVDPE